MFHSKGHGYDNPTMGDRKPCTAFEGLTVVANPLGMFDNAARESRSFASSTGPGVTYSSHALQIGFRTAPDYKREKGELVDDSHLFFMMSHGGGREVYSMRNGVYYHPVSDILLALPERDLYSLGYAIWQGMQETRTQAIAETDAKWQKALIEGRVVKRRAKGGRAAHYAIEDAWETAERERKQHNKRVTAEAREAVPA